MTNKESNKELEDWCDGFCKDFDRSCEEYDRRKKTVFYTGQYLTMRNTI